MPDSTSVCPSSCRARPKPVSTRWPRGWSTSNPPSGRSVAPTRSRSSTETDRSSTTSCSCRVRVSSTSSVPPSPCLGTVRCWRRSKGGGAPPCPSEPRWMSVSPRRRRVAPQLSRRRRQSGSPSSASTPTCRSDPSPASGAGNGMRSGRTTGATSRPRRCSARRPSSMPCRRARSVASGNYGPARPTSRDARRGRCWLTSNTYATASWPRSTRRPRAGGPTVDSWHPGSSNSPSPPSVGSSGRPTPPPSSCRARSHRSASVGWRPGSS